MGSSDLEKLKKQLLEAQNDLEQLTAPPADPKAQELTEQAESLPEPVQFTDEETGDMLKKTEELIQTLIGQE